MASFPMQKQRKYIPFNEDVGKSSLLLRFVENKFPNQHDSKLCVDFGSKLIEIDNRRIKLHIWDTAGKYSFKSINKAFYKGSAGALLIFDVSNMQSFLDVGNWLHEVKLQTHEKIQTFLVGNKNDPGANREVEETAAKEFALKNGFRGYVETSALSGDNVNEPFFLLCKQILKKVESGDIKPDDNSLNGVRSGKKVRSEFSNNEIKLKTPKEISSEEKCRC